MKLLILIITQFFFLSSWTQVAWDYSSGIYRDSNNKIEKLVDVEYETSFAYDTILKKVDLRNVRYKVNERSKLICYIDAKLEKTGVTITIIYPDYTSKTNVIPINKFLLVEDIIKYRDKDWLILVLKGKNGAALVLVNIPFMHWGKPRTLHLLPSLS